MARISADIDVVALHRSTSVNKSHVFIYLAYDDQSGEYQYGYGRDDP